MISLLKEKIDQILKSKINVIEKLNSFDKKDLIEFMSKKGCVKGV